MIQSPSLAIKLETGKGKAVEVIRYSFGISTERSEAVIHFATTYDGVDVWIACQRTQPSLLD